MCGSVCRLINSQVDVIKAACLLQAIDRPLFKDFWERFRECLTLLRDKHQRTVYRQAIFSLFDVVRGKGHVAKCYATCPAFSSYCSDELFTDLHSLLSKPGELQGNLSPLLHRRELATKCPKMVLKIWMWKGQDRAPSTLLACLVTVTLSVALCVTAFSLQSWATLSRTPRATSHGQNYVCLLLQQQTCWWIPDASRAS